MASSQTTRTIAAHFLAVLSAVLLVSCSSGGRDAVDGVLVFDEVVPLVRGEKVDAAKREVDVAGDATFVAMVDEDDYAIRIKLSHAGTAQIAPATVEVDSIMENESIEIAVLDAPKGSRLTLALQSPQGFDRPGAVRVKILRYDAERATDSRVAARLDALRMWSAATKPEITDDELHKAAFRRFDGAMAYFESADGDPTLGAWARMMRSKFNYRQFFDLKASVADAEIAERRFTELGQSRNAARARFRQAAALIEIAHDKAARDPGPEEAAQRAKRLMIDISHEPSMSALERAYALNYLGVLAFHVYDLVEARARWLEAIKAFEAVGHHTERLRVLGNLGAIAIEEGDYREATRYYDLVLADLDRFESTNSRVILLHNAARIDSIAGNVDRAIERYLRALDLSRTNKLQANEARILQGLGFAYWARGDNAQATALSEEALKIRRGLDDAYGMSDSLSGVGALAREAGDIPKALALHREAISFAKSADLRLFALLDLALDYRAASDYPNAIASAREALAIRVNIPNFYRRVDVQLALADMLLAQPRRPARAVREAATLTQESLDAALVRADTSREIAARRLLALTHEASGELRAAREEYEKAITLIFKYREAINNPELRAATLAHEQKTFRGYVDLLMLDVARRGPNQLRPATAAEEEALRTLEWARALNFYSHRNPRLDTASQMKLDDLLARMAGKRVRITSLLESETDSTKEIEALQVEIARLRTEADHLRASAAQGPGAEESALGAPAWPAVRSGVTQISYAIETRNAYAWVRDASGLRVTMLASTPASITRELENLAKAVRAPTPAQIDSSLSNLSRALLPPGAIPADTESLEIVAEGQITKVPFAALSLPSESTQSLSRRRSIIMVGSLFEPGIAPIPAKSHKWGFVALANDARGGAETPASRVFSTLPTTNTEARSIAALFQKLDPAPPVKLLFGSEGTASNLQGIWHDGIDAIHFATHGLADLRQPLASLLLLPAEDSAGNPAYLTAGQVQEWRGDANLVYLSACETAVGPARFADGLPGLQRAFLRAGARGVIATLWPVEDVYASQFASDFYRRYTSGMPAAEALSETQRDWMNPVPGLRASEQMPRRMTAWAHAFYAP